MKLSINTLLMVLIILVRAIPTFAQKSSDTTPTDTTYYQPYTRQITGRFYFSRKFTTLVLQNRTNGYTLRYRPNTTLNMGVGATYKWATLNLAYGFGFLNPERGRGKTRYLDLQFHSYGRRLVVDVLGQFYRGFYLSPRGRATADGTAYYQRPDLHVNIVGSTVQYVLNYKKFSYRAAFLQNEWQKKSAGTPLIGAEFYAGRVKADSTIIPNAIDAVEAARGTDKFRFVEFGPTAGYAYTYVRNKHFFATGSASVSLDVGINTFYDNIGTKTAVGLSPNTNFKISTGYNSSRWAVSFLYVTSSLRLARHDRERMINLNTGNFRVNLVHRFRPSRKVRDYLKVLDSVGDQVR